MLDTLKMSIGTARLNYGTKKMEVISKIRENVGTRAKKESDILHEIIESGQKPSSWSSQWDVWIRWMKLWKFCLDFEESETKREKNLEQKLDNWVRA